MRIVRDHQYVQPEDRGAVAAIGNFDGVHLGHQSVIALATDIADRTGAATAIVTFEPHPREHFAPDAPPFRLMNADAKAHRLEKLGIDTLFELNFNAALADLTPEAFSETILSEGLGLSHVIVGRDFCFGKGRTGTASDLEDHGRRFGFGVTIAPLLETAGIEVSSTRIREALSQGDTQAAARMLGHLHRIEGRVIRGEQRGRDLGYPTANISIDGLHLPRFGVYATRVIVFDGPHAGEYDAVSSLGTRPMFGENLPNLETHLFDFSGDLYGADISVALVAWLRPEEKFDSLDALIHQMDADSREARAILAR